MRIKDVEKLIISSLNDNTAGVNKNILNDAKLLTAQKKEAKKKTRYKYTIVWATVACFILCLSIVLPIMFLYRPTEEVKFTAYSSMQDYADKNSLGFKTYNSLFNTNLNPDSIPGQIQSPYRFESCNIVSAGGKDIYLVETYGYGNDTINIYLLLDDSEDASKELISRFECCNKEKKYLGVTVFYGYDEESCVGKATVELKGNKLFFEFNITTQPIMLSHLQTFLILQ